MPPPGCPLFLFDHLVVKTDDVLGVLAAQHLDRRLRMAVELPGDHVRDAKATVHLLLDRDELIANALQDRAQAELGILEEADEQFQRAIARAAPHAADRRVKPAGPLDQRLDRVGVRQLLVVVRVDADLDLAPLQRTLIGLDQIVNLLGIKRAEAVERCKGC